MSYRNPSRDIYNPGTDITVVATAPVTGKTFVTYSGNLSHTGNISVAPAAEGGHVAGVAKYDADTGELLGVARGSARVLEVTAGVALTAGAAVQVGADGRVVPAVDGVIVGWAVTAADINADARISLAH